jgi:hypothetical protein
MVFFMDNRKIGGFYSPRIFETELRMTDQVKYIGVILDKKLNWKAHLENRMGKACIAYWQCRRAVGLGTITESGGLGIHFCGGAHSFAWFVGIVEESRAEKCSETALSLAADYMNGNNWWYAFNTNIYFGGCVNVATLTVVLKEDARKAANSHLGNGSSYVSNFGHSEVLIRIKRLHWWLQGTNL